MAAGPEVLTHVYECLHTLKDGEVYGPACGLAAHYGVTVQTIYRWAAKRGLRWRKQKATKGTSNVTLPVLKQAGAMLLVSRRSNNQITMPACRAKEILDDSGIETNVSTSWFLARMRQEQVSARDLLRPTPHVRLLSHHPNHVWQFDVTNCLQYFLDPAKGMGERDQDMTLYKNKIVKTAKSIRRQLLRYAVVDHCTGAFYFRYFYASGERAQDGSTFLFEAMRPKKELIERYMPDTAASLAGKYLFHGVPLMLVADRGSIATARANQALFEALRVQLETHLPGNPRAKGAIEGLMHHLNTFESGLKFERPSSLDDLNLKALIWCIKINAGKLMRNTAPRSAMWSTITKEQLRICPDAELYRLLVREKEIDRTADGSGYISVDGHAYHIPDSQAVRSKVKVVRHPYEYPAVEVHFNGFIWLCQPIEYDRFGRLAEGVHYGEYKAPKETTTQAAAKDMEQIAAGWGLKWKGTASHRIAEAPPVGHVSGLTIYGGLDELPDTTYITRHGTPLDVKHPDAPANAPVTHDAFEVSRSPAERHISITDLLLRIKEEIGPISKDFNQALRAAYGDRIEDQEAYDVIEQIKAGTWQMTAISKKVVNTANG